MILKIKNTSKYELPAYAHSGDAGFDLRANLSRAITIPPLRRSIIPTGLFVDIPEGYEIQIRSKSGLAAKKGIIVLNSPATIDSPYTGEICIILFNTSDEPFTVEPGDRVAQAILSKFEVAEFVSVDEIDKVTTRADGGLGSTGIK